MNLWAIARSERFMWVDFLEMDYVSPSISVSIILRWTLWLTSTGTQSAARAQDGCTYSLMERDRICSSVSLFSALVRSHRAQGEAWTEVGTCWAILVNQAHHKARWALPGVHLAIMGGWTPRTNIMVRSSASYQTQPSRGAMIKKECTYISTRGQAVHVAHNFWQRRRWL